MMINQTAPYHRAGSGKASQHSSRHSKEGNHATSPSTPSLHQYQEEVMQSHQRHQEVTQSHHHLVTTRKKSHSTAQEQSSECTSCIAISEPISESQCVTSDSVVSTEVNLCRPHSGITSDITAGLQIECTHQFAVTSCRQ